MRVAMFHGAGKPITIEDVPDDPLPSGRVRIEVARCGICGSDVSMTSGSAFDYPVGCRLGHESAGTVIEVGAGVTALRLGDKVSVLPRGFCGQCPSCRAGRPLFCESGPDQMGGFGERLVITENSGFRMPESVSFGEGALVEPIACGRRAMRMARLQPGDDVLVLGAGSMGLAAVYWARTMGAGRIVVATRSPARHEIALVMGADAAVATGEDPEAIGKAFARAPAIVVEAIGKPGMLAQAMQHVRPCGTVISLGMCVTPDPVLPVMAGFQEVTVVFPLAYSAEDFVETLRAFDGGRIRPGIMVSETLGLSGLPALIEDMRGDHRHLKVQIEPAR